MLIDGSGFIDFILEGQLFFLVGCALLLASRIIVSHFPCSMQIARLWNYSGELTFSASKVVLMGLIISFCCSTWIICYFFPSNWLGASSHVVLFYFWHTYKDFSHKLQLNRVATFSKCRGIYGALIWFYLLELVNRIAMMKFWFSFFFLKNFIILFVIPIIGN